MLAAKHPQTPHQRKARAGRAAREHHSDNGNRQFFPTRKKLAPINDASLYIKYNRTLFVLDNSKIVLAVDYRSVRSQLASVPRSFPQQAFLESWPFRKYHGKINGVNEPYATTSKSRPTSCSFKNMPTWS